MLNVKLLFHTIALVYYICSGIMCVSTSSQLILGITEKKPRKVNACLCCVFAQIISPTTLFLAAKVEEQPRKLEHVIKVAHACLSPQETPPDTKSNVSSATDLEYLDLPSPSRGIPDVSIGRVFYMYLAVLKNHGNQGRPKRNCPGLPLHPVMFTFKTEPLRPPFGLFNSVIGGYIGG